MNKINNTQDGVKTNSLAIKVLEHISTYYYKDSILQQSNNVDKNNEFHSIAVHNLKGDRFNENNSSTNFIANLLGINAKDSPYSDIDSIIENTRDNPNEPVYISMNYGQEDQYGKFHGRHALRIESITKKNDRYEFILVNPWDNQQRESHSFSENELKNRKVRFSQFDLSKKYNEIRDELFDAVSSNNLEKTRQIIEKFPNVINQRATNTDAVKPSTPLGKAYTAECIDALLSAGADYLIEYQTKSSIQIPMYIKTLYTCNMQFLHDNKDYVSPAAKLFLQKELAKREKADPPVVYKLMEIIHQAKTTGNKIDLFSFPKQNPDLTTLKSIMVCLEDTPVLKKSIADFCLMQELIKEIPDEEKLKFLFVNNDKEPNKDFLKKHADLLFKSEAAKNWLNKKLEHEFQLALENTTKDFKSHNENILLFLNAGAEIEKIPRVYTDKQQSLQQHLTAITVKIATINNNGKYELLDKIFDHNAKLINEGVREHGANCLITALFLWDIGKCKQLLDKGVDYLQEYHPNKNSDTGKLKMYQYGLNGLMKLLNEPNATNEQKNYMNRCLKTLASEFLNKEMEKKSPPIGLSHNLI